MGFLCLWEWVYKPFDAQLLSRKCSIKLLQIIAEASRDPLSLRADAAHQYGAQRDRSLDASSIIHADADMCVLTVGYDELDICSAGAYKKLLNL